MNNSKCKGLKPDGFGYDEVGFEEKLAEKENFEKEILKILTEWVDDNDSTEGIDGDTMDIVLERCAHSDLPEAYKIHSFVMGSNGEDKTDGQLLEMIFDKLNQKYNKEGE